MAGGFGVRRWRFGADELAAGLRAATHRAGRRVRVGVIHQQTDAECGVACLAMILSRFGHSLSLPECRQRFGAGRDGMTARDILDAAREVGLEARGFRVDAAHIATVPLPVIAHWRGRHFVVVERTTRRHVHLVDPAVGRRRLAWREFAGGYSGTLLTFAPTPRMERRRGALRETHLRAAAHRLLTVGGARRYWGAILGASVVVQAFAALSPLLTKRVVDALTARPMVDNLVQVGAGMLAIAVTRALLAGVRAAAGAHLHHRLDGALTHAFLSRLLSLPYGYFQYRSDADLLARLSSSASVRDILSAQLLAVVLDAPLAVTYCIALALVSPPAAAVTVACAGVQIAAVVVGARIARPCAERALSRRAEENGYAIDVVKGVASLKAAGGEASALRRWSAIHRDCLRLALASDLRAACVDAVATMLRAAAPPAVLWVGAHEVLAGRLGLGTMLAVNALALNVLTPIASLSQQLQQLQLLRLHAERAADVLHSVPERTGHPPAPVDTLAGAFAVESLWVGHDRRRPAIRGVSFTVAAGTKVGIVGATGSGKSTLVKALLGLLEPTGGRVLVDGVELSTLDPRAVRRLCGVVLQDCSLFGGTLRENVALYHPDATDRELASAIEAAALAPDVVRFPLGLDTPIGDGGCALSGGQRQRVAIARALLGRPRVLLLDEATSHLDTETERCVMRALDALRCTRIVVAHRLSTVADADVVVVLRDGVVVEAGPPAALLRRDGEYRRLSLAQSHAIPPASRPLAAPVPGGLRRRAPPSARTDLAAGEPR